MIAREDHDRAIGLSRRVEPVEDARHLIVDLGEHAVVRGLQFALFLIVVGRLQERMVDHHAEQRMLCAFLGARRGAHRCGNRRGIEHRVVRRGREERRVRTQERHVREPTARIRTATVGPLDEPVGEELRLRVLGLVLRAPTRARPRAGRRTCATRRARRRRRRASIRATRTARPRGDGRPDRSRAARPRSGRGGRRRVRRCGGRCSCRCSRTAPVRSRGGGRPARRCRGGRRAGVPFSTDRLFIRYMPVYSAARLGPHGAAWAKWRRNETPPAASRSRFGVRTTGCAAALRQSPRHWSAVMNRTFTAGAMGIP